MTTQQSLSAARRIMNPICWLIGSIICIALQLLALLLHICGGTIISWGALLNLIILIWTVWISAQNHRQAVDAIAEALDTKRNKLFNE